MSISYYITMYTLFYFVHVQLCKSVKKFVHKTKPGSTWTKHANVSETNLNPVVWANNRIWVSLDQYVITKRKCEICINGKKNITTSHMGWHFR